MRADSLRVRFSVLAAFSTILVGWSLAPREAAAQLPGGLIVTITSPSSGSTVSGTTTVSASVSVAGVLVKGVHFTLDGANLGAEDTSAPYAVSWNTTGVGNGSHTLQAIARDALGLSYNSSPVTVTVSNGPPPDTTPPIVSITSPAAGATVSGTVTVSANASDNVGVAGVQFMVDGAALGAEDTSSPYSASWNTTSASNGSHSLTAVARDAAGNRTTSSAVIVTVTNGGGDTTPPAVNITSPGAGATVSGAINVTANASDNVGVAGVQFLVDGSALGAEDTASPYSVAWNTTTSANGSHSLTAVARDAAGNRTTSSAVIVTVSNGGGGGGTTRSEETAATLAPAGAWTPISSAAAGVTLSGDQAVYSAAAGATATFTFTGTGVSWIGFKCEVCGTARVHLDASSVVTIDTYAPSRPAASGVLYSATGLPSGSHTLVIEVTGAANASSGGANIDVDAFDVEGASSGGGDTTPPTVSITSPAGGATVTGTISVTASASDNVGVAGVQFLVDGAPIGTEDTSSPYAASWDTTTAANGSHSLTAVARDAAGNRATSATVAVTVSNGGGGGTAHRVEETDPSVQYTGSWIPQSRADLSGGSVVESNDPSGTATLTFTGTGISWIGFRGPWAGIAQVYLDGVLKATVDTYAPAEQAQAVMYSASGLASGSHTIKIQVTGTYSSSSTSGWILVDAFDVN